MTPDHRLYATLVRLYPGRFRHDCAEDMVLVFDELFEHKGRAATWRRVVVDLVVTLPLYRLETVMAPQRSTNALFAVAVAVALGAVATFAIGVWPVSAVLLLIAAVIGFTERTRLARSLRPENPSHRRRLLLRSAVLALIAIAVLTIGLFDLGDESHWPAGRLALYNMMFFSAIFAALAHLIVAARPPDHSNATSAS